MEGIRGINKYSKIDFNPGLTIIHGPNGTGKSSILQAVEWGLTGDIPYMKRGDFSKEDAIVNAFVRSSRARVILSFTGPQDIILTRDKKRARSTTSGKQNLVLDADKSYENADATEYLAYNMDFDVEEASRSKFLHQETIRDALTYTPAQRSAVIEKLLGTYDIKEFTKALDQKRKFTTEIKSIETRIEAVQRDHIQFIINLRGRLDELKEELYNKGFGGHELDLSYSIKEIDEIRSTLDAFALKLGATIIHPQIESNISSLINANRRISEDITSLDRKRMTEINTRSTKITSINHLSDTYNSALTNFRDYETYDIEGLENQKEEASIQKEEIQLEFKEKQRSLSLLPSRIAVYQSTTDEHKTQQELLEKMIIDTGDETQLQTKNNESSEKLVQIQNDLEKYSGQQQIINQATELIESTNPTQCPVCDQTINPVTLVNDLKSKVSSDITQKLTELNASQNTEKQHIINNNQSITALERIRFSLTDLIKRQNQAKSDLEVLIGEITANTNLANINRELEKQVEELGAKLSELDSKYREYDDKIRQFNHLNQEISTNKEKLQTELTVSYEGQDLLSEAKKTLERLQKQVEEHTKTSGLDILNKRQARLIEILGFLEDKEQTEKAEKDLPALRDQKNELEARLTGLKLLNGALSSIKDIVTNYQKDTSLQQIRNLEDSMNETFEAIQGHPYFTRIKIDIEKEEPLQFSFRAASDSEITYIPTRFSTAQLNIAALSIFLANSKLLAGELPLITLDDPTQNMDTAHKETFADFIQSLLERFQVIIATEDDDTRDKLIEFCPNATCYELESWTTEGPVLS
jgi:DNA repair protein SbcC/Rad50